MSDNEQATYACSCGVQHNRPKELGAPEGWAIFSHANGKSMLCPDCARTLKVSGKPILQGGGPTPIAVDKSDEDCMQLLRSGVYLNLADPDYSRVHIRDIAAGLSRECRFAGQLFGYYPVAQHCVIGSQIAPDEVKYAFLMHDAAEAVIKDIPSPLKRMLPDYRKVEAMHEQRIFERWQVPMSDDVKREVKRIDTIMLAAENVAVRFQTRVKAFATLSSQDCELAQVAISRIDQHANKAWERPFLDRFFAIAPMSVLEQERIAA